MHGRVKIRTTEEQAEAKRKEQQEKLKVYLKTTSKIFNKREKGECDDEALQLTGAILEHNPDFYSLWNYRRDILLAMKPEKSAEEIKALSTTELNLTQHCLQKNPKSYAAWHHRYWAMEFNPDADWKKELKLCGFFLSQDERNFHCWDYRRLVGKKCKVAAVDELNFSSELINSNFSNYSAWHYRSTLLPVVHPGPTKGSLAEDVMLEELELVHNAVFTDPDDQSAWFYHRWLLGRSKVLLQILNVAVLKSKHKVSVLLSEPERMDSQTLKLVINENNIEVVWETVSSYIPVSSVWVCTLPENVEVGDGDTISVELKKGEAESSLCLFIKNDEYFVWNKTSKGNAFRSELSSTTKQILESELESCQQLKEMEPHSKYHYKTDISKQIFVTALTLEVCTTSLRFSSFSPIMSIRKEENFPVTGTLFTSILLMRALNDVRFQETIKESMKSLKEIDSCRKNYYSDLESKIVIEDYIESLPLEAKEVNLANKNLSSLHHFDRFILIETINLSSNNLKSVFPLCHLISVKEIILDNNELTNFTGLEQLQNLKILSAKENLIESAHNLEVLIKCENLEELLIEGNPVLKDSEYLTVLDKLPALKINCALTQ